MKLSRLHSFLYLLFFSLTWSPGQTHFPADPFYLLLTEKAQFEGSLPLNPNLFRPLFFNSDSLSFSSTLRSESYYNDNAPNQENMDVRYFSKGIGQFYSINLTMNSPFFSFMLEPYIIKKSNIPVEGVLRNGTFSVLNDRPLTGSQNINSSNFIRNFLAFLHYKGIGIGWYKGNRWWGPGIHNSLQMTNNTHPFSGNIIGTLQEIRLGSFGVSAFYTFAKINNENGWRAKYLTSLNGHLTWHGPAIISLGFSRNYLSGGVKLEYYNWTEKDARNIVFEGFFESNLIQKEYTVGGHDPWDQTLSGYLSIILPKSGLKIYTEFGWNDNTMFFADFLSQFDHSMSYVIGIRDIGIGNLKNWVYGLEWTNLMVTYTSRFRTGMSTFYNKELYDYSTYKGRRWAAHSGSDSDDWYIYAGYLSDKLMVIPAVNYERHGIVSHRPAEVKLEFRLDTRYKYKDIWFGIYYENQFESFLGFPDYFYVNEQGESIDASTGKLANSRRTNTLIFSLMKTINF